jgi:hypothetical protein
MNDSPLQILCHDISSKIEDYLPIFERKKFWEDLGDKVKGIILKKTKNRESILREIISRRLEEPWEKKLLQKIDYLYGLNDQCSGGFGIYCIADKFTYLYHEEYWKSPCDNEDDYDDVVGACCDYVDGNMDEIKLKDGITYDMIPYHKEHNNKYGVYNAKMLFDKVSNIEGPLSRQGFNNIIDDEKGSYVVTNNYLEQLLDSEEGMKLFIEDKKVMKKELNNCKFLYQSLKDLTLERDKEAGTRDYVIENCDKMINLIKELKKDIEDF